MSFGPNHYVPTLKLKPAEKTALPAVSPRHFAHISPLLEVIEFNPEKAKDATAHVEDTLRGISNVVKVYPRFFLDTREIADLGQELVRYAFDQAAGTGVPLIPVTGMSRTVDLQPALALTRHGLALRVTREEVESAACERQMRAFVAKHHLEFGGVDLILDMGSVEDMIPDGALRLAHTFMSNVPDVRLWRSVTLTGCAFPKSLSAIERNGHGMAPRTEWMAWRSLLLEHRNELKRMPSFGDCAIQNLKGVERPKFSKKMQMSAALRYTLAEDWLLIKGESQNTTPFSEQFPRLATALVHGHLKSHFAGSSHCSGCRDAQLTPQQPEGHSSLGVWRRFGTIHHLTVVRETMDSLFGPSDSLAPRR